MNSALNANLRPRRPGTLISRQWQNYSPGHRDRMNLALHALSVPFFWAGNVGVATGAIARSPTLATIGIAAMLFALLVQGRGHRNEEVKPEPFRGPFDLVARFVTEQWLTFPRYVATGGFARAWRDAKASAGGAPRA